MRPLSFTARAINPTDRRCLLSLHPGSVLHEHTRVSTKGEKPTAQQIQRHSTPKVCALRDALLKEFKGEVLKLRRGKVEALPDAREELPVVDRPTARFGISRY